MVGWTRASRQGTFRDVQFAQIRRRFIRRNYMIWMAYGFSLAVFWLGEGCWWPVVGIVGYRLLLINSMSVMLLLLLGKCRSGARSKCS